MQTSSVEQRVQPSASRPTADQTSPRAGSTGLRYKERYGSAPANRSLRVATGGCGQSGLLKAWAEKFIQDCDSKGLEPFHVDWYLGDTTDSLGFLQDGLVDVAITYNDAAERQSLQMGYAKRRVYAFKDHFFLVGPPSDPAKLDDAVDVLDAFNKIVTSGNHDVTTPPKQPPPTRFLSRFDKSATNIKESQLFITIGQVPWALAYSKWYHQYPRFPLEALQAAAALSEYTLTDKGIWLSSPPQVRDVLRIYRRGDDYKNDPDHWLLNPGRALLGAKAVEKDLANRFLDWLIEDNGGPEVILNFKKGDPQETVFAPVPENERLS